MQKDAPIWSVPVAVEEIPETGLHVRIEAPADVRAGLARLASVREISELTAEFDIFRRGAGIRVTGRVRARVGQICVVTLEPLEHAVDEAVDLLFTPQPGAPVADTAEAAEEAPEALIDGKIDVGALAAEFLVLGIDPYPRKAGVEFVPPHVENAGDKPFAALAALKKRPGSGTS